MSTSLFVKDVQLIEIQFSLISIWIIWIILIIFKLHLNNNLYKMFNLWF